MYCTNCGKEIDERAVVCPGCGIPTAESKPKKKKHPVLIALVVIIAIFIIVAAVSGGGGSDEPKKVTSNAQTNVSNESESTAPLTEPENKNFTVGDAVELNGITVTLVNVSESTGAGFMSPDDGKIFVTCEFEIENNSKKDIAVSSLISFEAYIDQYTTNMSLSAIMASEKGQLDGTVAAGKKMNGAIGYEASEDWKDIEIRFTPDFWAGKDIVFTYSK